MHSHTRTARTKDAAPHRAIELRAAPTKPRAKIWQPNGKMRNPAREREKEEIASLRHQLVELEARLKEIVAQRSLALQTEAALVNRRLRNELRLQLTYRRRLLAMLSELERRVLPLIYPEPIPVAPHLLHDENGYRFAYLTDKVAGSIRNMDAIMASAGGVDPEQSITTSISSRKVDGHDHLVVVNREGKTIPCDLETWCGAIWRAVDASAWGKYSEVKVFHADEKRKVTRQYFERQHQGVVLHFVTSVVVEQVVEKDRVRLVYETVTSCDDYTPGDLCVEESGWLSYRAHSTPEGEGISFELVRHAMPRLIGESTAESVLVRPEARVLLNACLAITSEVGVSISDLSENLLIEELMDTSL